MIAIRIQDGGLNQMWTWIGSADGIGQRGQNEIRSELCGEIERRVGNSVESTSVFGKIPF
jgi:hypothetical protein